MHLRPSALLLIMPTAKGLRMNLSPTQRNLLESNVQLFEVTCAMHTLHPEKTQ